MHYTYNVDIISFLKNVHNYGTHQAHTHDFGRGEFFTKLRWTFPDLQQTATHSPMADPGFELGGGAHSQIVSAQNALLGGSGLWGKPLQENFGF